MGMTSNQIELIRYVAENNLQKAKEYAICCCTEDTTQKNKWSVARYKKLLQSGSMNMIELPHNLGQFATLEDVTNTYLEKRYYLTEEEKKLYELIKNMNDVSLQLMEKQIPYLNATLLYGESGVGKTAFAKYVAYKLEIPYLYVNFSKMIDSLLGGTAKNLANLFNFINQQKCVVMLDEIDCISTKRKYSDGGASAEVSRSTTCLLQLLDAVTNDHVVIGATNIIEDIDSAVKRRFTEKHEIHRLTCEDNKKFIVQYLDDTGFSYKIENITEYSKGKHSQAEIMTHMTRCIANSLIYKKEIVTL
ncbi:MAG: AAA family ATPase [Aminipila sp.]